MRTMKTVALVLGLLAFSGVALRADILVLTGTYNNIPGTFNAGGGSLSGATLNGVALPWVYCVQIGVDVSVPGTYNQTISDFTGVIHNTDTHPTGAQAAQIASLLTLYANGADVEHQIALQAAIWHEEGFGALTGGTTNEETYYSAMLAAAGAGNSALIGNFDWMTPGVGGSNQYQGLVTQIPDGGMTLMLLGGALVGIETLRRRVRA